jgi:hypothetical protein
VSALLPTLVIALATIGGVYALTRMWLDWHARDREVEPIEVPAGPTAVPLADRGLFVVLVPSVFKDRFVLPPGPCVFEYVRAAMDYARTVNGVVARLDLVASYDWLPGAPHAAVESPRGG